MAVSKITSLNVRGLNDENKRRNLFTWLSDLGNKIVYLQETFCRKEFDKFSDCGWKGEIYHNLTDSSHSRGVAILIHETLDCKILNIHKKSDSRAILINAEVENMEVSLCCVYAPNKEADRKDFFKKLKLWIYRNSDYPENLIVGGDFNCAINNDDRTGKNNDTSRNELKQFLNGLKLLDAWYICNNKRQYTFHDVQHNSKSRIDYIFISKGMEHKVKSIKLRQAPQKDKHKAVQIALSLCNNKKGPGYWKLNSKILVLPEYRKLIENIVNDCMTNYNNLEKRILWEIIKIRVKEESIKFGIARAKLNRDKISKLQNELDTLNKQADEGNNIDKNRKSEIENEIQGYYDEKREGSIIRSKIKWIKEGEKSTAFFFGLEKSMQKKNVICKLKNNDGELCTEDSDILKMIWEFYDDLFSSRNVSQTDINNYLNSCKIDVGLNDKQVKDCDQDITLTELKKVVKNLKTGKSPGCDGITPEFYKTFWDIIQTPFLDMLRETYTHGELPYTVRKAIVALLYKKGDDTLLKNYRPISLTNYDYKILCFVLASRLQGVLKDLVHHDQTGYIKGRFIGNNARLIQDYFDYCENFDVPGILLFLDFEKAFDSVEWNFMFSVLEKLNFGEKFIKWVKILYTNPVISIKNNGWLSKDVKLGRGVRQGCPLSALLFVLIVEILAINIRNNQNINGFNCQDKEIKVSLYADDSTLLLNDFKSMSNAIDTIVDFSKVAGPKLNVEKTEGILLGPFKNTRNSFKGVTFTNHAIRCLGIYIGHDQAECYQRNWEDKIEKIQLVLEKWKDRDLTFFGKTLILKSLAISKFIHVMSILKTPDKIKKEIEKLMFGFIWNSNDRIKRKTLIGPKSNGGINMLDIYCKDKSLKAAWIARLSDENNVNRIFLQHMLHTSGITVDYLIKCDIRDGNFLCNCLKIPDFWGEVFVYLNECKSTKKVELMNDYDFFSEPIWFNSRYTHKNNPLFFKNWIKSGILYVKDLFLNGRLISEKEILDKLINKTDWIRELMIVKTLFMKIVNNFNPLIAKHVNIRNVWMLVSNNSRYCIKTQKSNFYYTLLIKRKFERNYMERFWGKTFNFEPCEWESIYNRKVWNVAEKKVAEFNYKLITNIVCTRSIISKWNRNVNNLCMLCNDKQDVKHLLFTCSRVNNMWANIGAIIKLNIQYKHIIIGDKESNSYIKSRNLLISYITYGIYKFWILSENNKLDFNNTCLYDFIRKHLFKKTLVINDRIFHMLCDKIIRNL